MDVACANSYIVYNMMHPILKPLFQPIWVEGTQVKVEYHQMTKQVPKESISMKLGKVNYHYIFQSFKMFGDNVNITTKKELT